MSLGKMAYNPIVSADSYAGSSSLASMLAHTNAKYVDTAQRDIQQALSCFTGLSPTMENFLFPDGKRSLALCLKGCIPVQYQGDTYNIPVAFYLWDTHPFNAPMCFVCPTPSMTIRESRAVDKHGQVYLPYLSDWRFPGYDLSGLIQVLVLCFQESCPVFSKPALAANNIRTARRNVVDTLPYPINAPNSDDNALQSTSRRDGVAAGNGSEDRLHSNASILGVIAEIIRSRLEQRLGPMHAELLASEQVQKELREGDTKIRKILHEIAIEQNRIDIIFSAYQKRKAELQSLLQSHSSPRSSKLDIDSVTDACTPLHRQLVSSYVNDCAIDDAIYVLGNALKAGRISVTMYLKEVRQLSRKQFIFRATFLKCRSKAKLPD